MVVVSVLVVGSVVGVGRALLIFDLGFLFAAATPAFEGMLRFCLAMA